MGPSHLRRHQQTIPRDAEIQQDEAGFQECQRGPLSLYQVSNLGKDMERNSLDREFNILSCLKGGFVNIT